MVFYETTYILHSALQEGRLNDIVKVIEKKAESLGAKILFSDNWGRKKLSYLIEKEKYGTYIFFQYKIEDVSKLSELSAEFEHNPNVLRYLNIRIEEEDIMEEKSSEKSDNTSKSSDKKNQEEPSSNLKATKEESNNVEEVKATEEESNNVEEVKATEEESNVEEVKATEEESNVEEAKVTEEDSKDIDENKTEEENK